MLAVVNAELSRRRLLPTTVAYRVIAQHGASDAVCNSCFTGAVASDHAAEQNLAQHDRSTHLTATQPRTA